MSRNDGSIIDETGTNPYCFFSRGVTDETCTVKRAKGVLITNIDYNEKDSLSFYSRRGIEQSLSSFCLRITPQHYLCLWITSLLTIVYWLSWGRDGYLWEEQGLTQVHILAIFLFCTPHGEPYMFPQYTCVVHTFYSPHSSAWTLLPKPRTQQAYSLEIRMPASSRILRWFLCLERPCKRHVVCFLLTMKVAGGWGSSLWGGTILPSNSSDSIVSFVTSTGTHTARREGS